jgi:plasmid stability protein
MRTTVDLPDDLLSEAKERAAREGRSLSEVVRDAVRAGFARTAASTAEEAPVELPTFAGGGLQPGVDLDDGAALLDLMERG